MKKIFLLLAFTCIAQAQKPIFSTAKTKAATVYFNSAELSQNATAAIPKGNSELVIKNVADFVNTNTIRFSVPPGITVLSVQHTNNYVQEYDTEAKSPSQKVRDSIALLEKQVNLTINLKDAEAKTIELLDANQKILGGGTGNLAELTKWLAYYRAERIKAANAFDDFEKRLKTEHAKLVALKNRLDLNPQGEDKTSRGKIILQLASTVAVNASFDFSYLSPNASWTPFYEMQSTAGSPIATSYNAKVRQTTGVDWKQVKLTFSSGNPDQSNEAPLLNPWFLRYSRAFRDGDDANNYNYYRGNLYTKRPPLAKKELASNFAYLDTVSVGLDVSTADFDITESQLNTSFDIDIPYDILSNGKMNVVTLKKMDMPAQYKYYAIPTKENEAFLLAEVPAYSQYNLLPGEANIIIDDMYVGRTSIEPSQTSDTLAISMGRDKKISIKRLKIAEKSGTKFLSSKKEQTFTYETTIRNNKKEDITLQLLDQYPLSTDKETEVELKQKDGAKENTETGLLTWDLTIKAGETKKIRISYLVRSPKEKTIENL